MTVVLQAQPSARVVRYLLLRQGTGTVVRLPSVLPAESPSGFTISIPGRGRIRKFVLIGPDGPCWEYEGPVLDALCAGDLLVVQW